MTFLLSWANFRITPQYTDRREARNKLFSRIFSKVRGSDRHLRLYSVTVDDSLCSFSPFTYYPKNQPPSKSEFQIGICGSIPLQLVTSCASFPHLSATQKINPPPGSQRNPLGSKPVSMFFDGTTDGIYVRLGLSSLGPQYTFTGEAKN